MARMPAAKVQSPDAECKAMVDCDYLIAKAMPAVQVDDDNAPYALECLNFHDELAGIRRKLLKRGLTYVQILPALQDHARQRPCPLTDALRRSNGLDTTFGESIA
jgi:hypothetical protein